MAASLYSGCSKIPSDESCFSKGGRWNLVLGRAAFVVGVPPLNCQVSRELVKCSDRPLRSSANRCPQVYLYTLCPCFMACGRLN